LLDAMDIPMSPSDDRLMFHYIMKGEFTILSKYFKIRNPQTEFTE